MKNRGFIVVLIMLFKVVIAQPVITLPDSSSLYSNESYSFAIIDSFTTKTFKHQISKWLLSSVWKDKKGLTTESSYDYYKTFEGKIISSIKFEIKDAFEPSFDENDTSQVQHKRINDLGNKLHSKTRISYLRKKVWFTIGDTVDAQIMTENERFIRSMNSIKDVRFRISQDTVYANRVHVLVLVKDLFSIGVSGEANSIYSANVELFNHNVFGIGHDVSLKFVGNANSKHVAGLEAYYAINNISGKNINIQTGYVNTYKRDGYIASINRDFYTTSLFWAGGLQFNSFTRTYNVYSQETIINNFPLSFKHFDEWQGYNFQLGNKKRTTNNQLTITQRIRYINFYRRPESSPDYLQYYANNCFYLLGFTYSHQSFRKGYLIYSYGITEDIPIGFKLEWDLGYNENEFDDMFYSHLKFSNRVHYRNDSYLYYSIEIGGYFNEEKVTRGLVNSNIEYITPLYQISPDFRLRQFISLNYVKGINRLTIENLYLNGKYGIRGFPNSTIIGQQRLTLKLETVAFQRQSLLKFNLAYFGFTDLGWIGKEFETIFKQDFYSGIGLGIRIRNENLVFNTIEFRIAYYFSNGFGINLDERNKSKFAGFNPEKPDILYFQ